MTPDEEIRALEKELIELERYILDFWSFCPTPLAYLNPQEIIMDVDNSLCQLTGYAKEDLIGKKLSELVPQSNLLDRIFADSLTSSTAKNRQVNLLTRAGQLIAVTLSLTVRRDAEGHQIGYFVSFDDLSEINLIQKQLEDKITELKEFNDLAIGRELKMIELENEVELLKQALKQKD